MADAAEHKVEGLPSTAERVAWTVETAAARERGRQGRENRALVRRSETASSRDSCHACRASIRVETKRAMDSRW